MALKTEHLKDAKAALKAMSARREKTLRKADFIAGLLHDIHTRMSAGFTLEEICEELNKALPDGEQLKLNTFKTYVRKARTEAGGGADPGMDAPDRSPATKTPTSLVKGRSNTPKEDPASGFRDQGGEL